MPLFCLISKLFTLDNIIFNYASLNINYLGSIIFGIKQKGMEYLLINKPEQLLIRLQLYDVPKYLVKYLQMRTMKYF